MGSPFTLVAKVRKPTRVLTRPWEMFLEASGRRVRAKDWSNCYFDPYAGAVMLSPEVYPENDSFSHPKDLYSLYVGASPVLAPQAWVEGQGAFGDGGFYVAFAGNSTYPATTPWMAVRTASRPIEANRAINVVFHWSPPSASSFVPSLEIYPRIDTTRSATINGYTYYFAPLSLCIDAQTATLTVREYEYDSYDQFVADPSQMLRPTYQHSIELGALGLTNGWFSLMILPLLQEWVSAADGLTYTYHDFSVRSPQLEGGGFCYRTQVKRTSLSLFPRGMPAIRSLIGGICGLNISPVYFPNDGYFLTETITKREKDADTPTVSSDRYLPSTAELRYGVVYPESYPTPILIPTGESFQQFRVRVSVDATDDDRETPVVYRVKTDFTGTVVDRVQVELDVSDDISVHESFTEDLTGYAATVTLRNPTGAYNALVYRPTNEITLKVQGIDRAVLYTLDPAFKWYETPTKEVLRIGWNCGDFWERMKRMYVSSHPDYGNQSIKAALTSYFQRIGFNTTKLHIAASLDLVYLPQSPMKDDPLFQPQDGSTADEFVADMREKYFSTYPTGFDGVGDFWIAEPLKPHTNPSAIMQTYYLSMAQADAVGEANPYFCGKPEVTFKHDEHKNEIWVVGVEPQTEKPIIDVWLDKASQIDESYLYYVGERRLMIVFTRLPTLFLVNAYLEQLKKVFGYVRRHIRFETKFNPLLMPNDFINFYGLGFVFQVLSVDTPIEAGHVSFPNESDPHDGAVYGCTIEALEYPVEL